MPRPAPWIAVVGPGRDAPHDELLQAEEAGAAVAEAGAILVCGGLGGVMEAACRGARSRGGVTVGLLPGVDRDDANGWVRSPSRPGWARRATRWSCGPPTRSSAIGGGWGTLSEIALALRAGLPVIGVDTWEPVRAGAPVAGVVGVDDGRTAVDGGAATDGARAAA